MQVLYRLMIDYRELFDNREIKIKSVDDPSYALTWIWETNWDEVKMTKDTEHDRRK